MNDAAPSSDVPPPAPGDGGVMLSGHAAYVQATLDLITRAHLQLRVLSHELDRRVWNDPGVVELLRSFALRSPRAELRILVLRPQVAAQRGHRLVELARRLSSRIQIRELDQERRPVGDEFAIADEHAVLQRHSPAALEAQWQAHAPLDARRLRRRFDLLWEEATPARELSSLHL